MEPRFLGELFVEIRVHNGAAETAKPTHDIPRTLMLIRLFKLTPRCCD
jgi:hypothetical protein